MKTIIKNIFSILDQKERRQVLGLILLDIIISLLDIFFLASLIYIIQFYTLGTNGIELPFRSFFSRYPLSLITGFFILFALKNTMAYLVFKTQYSFVYAVAARLSRKTLLQYLRGGFKDYIQIDSAVHIRKISQQPIQFGHHVLAGFQQLVGNLILVSLTIIAILIFSPMLFILLLIILTPALFVIGLLLKKKLDRIRKLAKPVSELSLQHLQQGLAGYIESNIYQSNSFFIDRYGSYQASFNDFLSRQLVLQNLPSRFMEVFALFGLLVLIILNFYGNNNSNIQLTTISAFMAAAYRIIPGIVKILNSTGQIKTYNYTITDLINIPPNTTTEEKINMPAISTITIDHLSFTHKTKKLLNNFSMQVKAGEMLGIKGSSGKGKTTVLNLLLGFLDQSDGDILINNTVTTAAERRQYQCRFAYAKQHTFLLHDTILNNITLSDDIKDEQQLQQAAQAAGLDIFPQGLQTYITENGKNISGGQRQRIAIARALYKNADCIILDEPFNELDQISENKLLLYFQSLAAAGKIVILITHNTMSLSYCSKIISLDG